MSQACKDREEAKQFFFEKKNQRTFESWVEPTWRDRSQICKSFLLLFFKKEGLASCPAR
jgi:hypothetical protein